MDGGHTLGQRGQRGHCKDQACGKGLAPTEDEGDLGKNREKAGGIQHLEEEGGGSTLWDGRCERGWIGVDGALSAERQEEAG